MFNHQLCDALLLFLEKKVDFLHPECDILSESGSLLLVQEISSNTGALELIHALIVHREGRVHPSSHFRDLEISLEAERGHGHFKRVFRLIS